MALQFVRCKEFIAQYREENPGKDSMLWLDLLNEALESTDAEVLSVGYDSMGEPMTMLLKTEDDVPSAEIWGT